ncbi:MAG: hypothetical protein A2499_05150 [Stygiobacter sp. RIFOXYC12_FULL_38_8]|nr:MAG: hypothetical protein FD122_1108 [Stygiobacter sp.]OGU67072.1 MAG: hypothetical protein A2X62_09930 [Stygiobacter sp. GWC2_38_9]OGU83824.1 MAG: hypothetical protein A2279_08755 [Stygiobacter sp. RIFOXYA12_FULL_38_9]OGV07461.1 MAG: hypothetical protein A2299_17800 [Stygiobacter sp. RIFOXYB2_FULL_37_11]OGV12294.1 MAG: hypothetical protein A2237_16485 [Stygiobacter sp. RIFOXYA2_FULL_38_8]OGV13720.1 MAG: hypothetical protein A2440_11200 [Stygiobacter sp. RIFOXYC2_FULL_38_25]OGV22370.1 MAG:
MESVIAVFIPIIITMVVGLVITLAIYFKSKEKQMMIEKGLSTEQMFELLHSREKERRNGYYMLKGGIILVFLVAGGIIGSIIDRSFFNYWETYEGGRYYHNDPVYGVWLTFLGLGIGAIVAHFISRKVEAKEEAQK